MPSINLYAPGVLGFWAPRISVFSKLSHLIWSSRFGLRSKITREARSHFYTFIKLVFKMSLLIRETTVTDVRSCGVCCCREELLASVCTRQISLWHPFLFYWDELNGHFYGDDFIHVCLSDRGIKECQKQGHPVWPAENEPLAPPHSGIQELFQESSNIRNSWVQVNRLKYWMVAVMLVFQ